MLAGWRFVYVQDFYHFTVSSILIFANGISFSVFGIQWQVYIERSDLAVVSLVAHLVK